MFCGIKGFFELGKIRLICQISQIRPISLQLPNNGASAVKYPPVCLSGDHTRKVLPVPIPNTAVKLSGPMIVPTSVKVGIAGFSKKPFLS